MGRTAIADTGLWSYLKSLGQPKGFIVGLILGQSSGNKDFIVHLVRTPHSAPTKDVTVEKTVTDISPESSEADEFLQPPVFSSVKEIKDLWVADHAKQVTRMLPGGMWVLGLFLVGPNDPFTDQSDCSRLHSILRSIRSTLQQNESLHGDSPSSEKLLLHVNNKTNTISCRSVDVNSSSQLKSAEWKFQKNPTHWHQIECSLHLEQLFHLCQRDSSLSLQRQLQIIQDRVRENVEKSVCTIDGEIRDTSELLEALDKKRKSKSNMKKGGKSSVTEEEAKILKANLYLPMVEQAETDKSETGAQDLKGVGEMNVVGNIRCRVFLHQKAAVEEAVNALKQDMVRSLAARLEMHLDSVIEEEQGSPEELLTLHEPPRRVMVPLPYAPVTLSDYLFPGEGPMEALASSLELLDLDLNETDVQKDIEVQTDPVEVFGWVKQPDSEVLTEVKPARNSKSNLLYIILIVSALILLVSLGIQMSGILS